MIDWSDLSNRERAGRLLPILAEMAHADGTFDPREQSFLRQLAAQHGLSTTEATAALSQNPSPTLRPPVAERDRMTVLYYLLFLSQADRDVDPAEEEVLHRYGLRLGIRPALVSDFLALAREHRASDIPPTEMIARIRRYLN